MAVRKAGLQGGSAEPELVRRDPMLAPHAEAIRRRMERADAMERRLRGKRRSLANVAAGHEYFGLHRTADGWVFREWAPAAEELRLIGEFSNWKPDPAFALRRLDAPGQWGIELPADALQHGDLYKLWVRWPGGQGERVPAYARRVLQDPDTKLMSAQVWEPRVPHVWAHPDWRCPQAAPRIYEAHVGMAQEEPKVGSFDEFRLNVLPRIVDAGYNAVQFMAVAEHPYYGSFGYHVTSFFAVSSRFGTPDDFKALVDAAHGAGLMVIMDLVHSHAARNEAEGLGRFDGTHYQYFHDGDRGVHTAWDSRCFDYGKPEVLHFLLSNARFWLDEYRVDGFRFDGVTSMLYRDHGLGRPFTCYDDYFGDNVDEDAIAYLSLANRVIHTVRPDAITIAEDVSGLPGLALPVEAGGVGFDYRLAMGVPDYWIKLIKEVPDEHWHMGRLYHELTNRRPEEKCIAYAESHDQALVGDQTLIFRLVGADMYTDMNRFTSNLRVDRGMALHKMIRLITFGTAGGGYLNFMGNEFGHPEWIDFPRVGNQWSYHYARRQWHLRDDPNLRYAFLGDFDRALMRLGAASNLLETEGPNFGFEHLADQTLGFERAGYLWVFNFNPARSFADYPVYAAPGRYELALNTDSPAYGGHGHVMDGQVYLTRQEPGTGRHLVSVYLPARTALVLRRD